MRHQKLGTREAFDIVDSARLRELNDRMEARPQPARAVPEMPKAAGMFVIAAYAAIMAAFVLTVHGARSEFAILIGVFYLAMFFGVPAVFLGIDAGDERRPGLGEFLDQGVETATGHLSGAGALVQMLIVPVLLALGVLAMGITYLLV